MDATSVWQALVSLISAYTLPWTETLLHFLWQGGLIGLGYALVLLALRRASANARYLAGVFALLAMGLCLPVTFLLLPTPTPMVSGQTPLGEVATSDASATPRVAPEPMELATPTLEAAPVATVPTAVLAHENVPLSTRGEPTWSLSLAGAAPYASGLYLVGVTLMLLRVCLGLQAGRRLRAVCTPVTDGTLLETLETQARRLGLRVVPMVAYCQRVSVPVVVGLLRPMILLPTSLVTGLTPRQLEAILVHELAHIRRFDLAIQVLQRLLEAVLFFHPVVWWLSRRISLERENACDDLVLRADCGRLEYAEALVRLAEACLAVPSSSATVAATGGRSSHFRRRVLRLLGQQETPTVRLTTGGLFFSVALLLAVLLLPVAWRGTATASEDSKAQSQESPDPQGSLPVRVVDEQGKPLAGVKLQVRANSYQAGTTTDAEGKAIVTFPLQDTGSVYLDAEIDSYPSQWRQWRNQRTPDWIPKEFTFTFRQGHRVGGMVQDEQGKPIEGVKVILLVFPEEELPGEAKHSGWPDLRTDAEGRWHVEHVPTTNYRAGLLLEHPDFATDGMARGLSAEEWTQLERGELVQVLIKGVALHGTVTDPSGKPVADARVDLGEERFGSEYPTTKSDAAGHYEFPRIKPGKQTITVTKPGLAPALRSVEVKPGMAPVDFALEKGNTLRVRVVDGQNRPVQGVRILADTWRGRRSLADSEFRGKTDAEGRWTCTWAPADTIEMDILHKGYMAIRQHPLTPQESEHVVTLAPELMISGHVLDAETKEPIPQFQIVEGYTPRVAGPVPPGAVLPVTPPHWEISDVMEGRDGHFRLLFGESVQARRLGIEAPGYESTVTREFSNDEGETTVEVFLKRSPSAPGSGQASQEPNVSGLPAMSAEEFARFSLAEQRAVLTRAFQRRLEQAKNLSYEAELSNRAYKNQNGSPGQPINETSYSQRSHYWRLGDSYRLDMLDRYRSSSKPEEVMSRSEGVNAAEGVGRNTTVWVDGSHPPQGQVQYAYGFGGINPYFAWLAPTPLKRAGSESQYLFPYLLDHLNTCEIAVSVAEDKVRLTVPWSPAWGDPQGGKQVFLLDPRKGFLPVRGDARYDDPPGKKGLGWYEEHFSVEASQQVGEVWMPTELTTTGIGAARPEQIGVYKIKILRIESGTVQPRQLFVPFPEGANIQDILEGATYVTDAQGRPAGEVKFDANWKRQPPEGWTLHAGAGGYSLLSSLSETDHASLRQQILAREESFKPTDAAYQTMQASSPGSKEEQEAALQLLREGKMDGREVAYFSAFRALIQAGKPAVPRLIEELDRTEGDRMLRNLAIVLREIGDPRAVPALIRAIPRTLLPVSNDYGLLIEGDRELHKFMQEHAGGKGAHFDYGRPPREVLSALKRMTGETLDQDNILGVSLADNPPQQRLQRQLYLKLAQRWATWWNEHWRELVPNEQEAQLEVIQKAVERAAQAVEATASSSASSAFPHGPQVVNTDETRNWMIRSFVESRSQGCWDLDTGRHPKPPAELVKQSTPDRPSAELLAWAEREGVDLITIQFTPPGSEKPAYAFWPVGLKAWRVANDFYKNLPKGLQDGAPDLSQPWEGPLAQRDEKTGAYDEKAAMAFLFQTREGTCGAMQLKPPLRQEYVEGSVCMADGGLEYRFLYQKPAEE